MKPISLILTASFLVTGCGGGMYRDALCKLSVGSEGVATHYAEYVSNEPDASTKAAREAESKQFQAAVAEAKQQCGN
jgi:hypothetical protein